MYDRRRLEAMVTSHKMRVHRMRKATDKQRIVVTGAKTPR